MKSLCIIVGFGTGVGLGIARAFGNAGFQLGLIARNPSKYADAIAALSESGIESSIEAADVSDAALIETHFGALKDPRSPNRIEHKLIDILIMTICTTIC